MKKTNSKTTARRPRAAKGQGVKALIPEEIRNEGSHMIANGLSEAIMGFEPGGFGTQLSQVDTLFRNNRWYLVSNMRQLLSEIYVEHGLIQTVVDVPVDDGLRGGIEIKTKQLDEEQIEQLQNVMERENDIGTMGQALKWNRLFGGAGVVIITGQDPSTPLDIEALKKGSPFEFRAVDMWELFWSKQNTSDYSAAIDGNQTKDVEFYDYYGVRLHHSRVIKLKGLEAPSFVRPRLRGWGFSIVESLIRSINQYLKSNNLVFEVLDEFKVDYFKIKNLANSLLSPNGQEAVRRRVALANQQKNFQHAVVMDSEDDYIARELSFAGISETMIGIRMQIASDMRMPLTKVFGISAAGFSSGEDDIENYNSMVESQVRQKSKFDILKMVELRCQLLFGFIPDDIKIEFKPLRVLNAEQEENVKTQKFNRLLQAKQAGEISSKEFKDACNRDNLLPVKLDTTVDSIEVDGPDDEAAEVPDVKAPKSSLTAKEAPVAKNELEIPRIAVVGVICGNEILTGRRKDNNLWTFPGGHMDGGETPEQAAVRECYEEAGVDLTDVPIKSLPVKRFKSHRAEGKVFEVHAFIAEVDKKVMPRTILDPDDEISVWRWVPIDEETHELKPENRHAKNDVILQHLL